MVKPNLFRQMSNSYTRPDRFDVEDYHFDSDNPNYEKMACFIYQHLKSFFPQISFFSEKLLESLYIPETPPTLFTIIQSSFVEYKTSNIFFESKTFKSYSEEEINIRLDRIVEHINTPNILDFLLAINFIYDSFPKFTEKLDGMLFEISKKNQYPLIQLALISQLFSMPSRRISCLLGDYQVQDIENPGKIVSCIFDQSAKQVLPLTLSFPHFQVSTNSIFIQYLETNHIFNPSTKMVAYFKPNQIKNIQTVEFSHFLIDDSEKIEDIAVFKKRLCVVQRMSSRELRVTFFLNGLLSKQRRYGIIQLDDDYSYCRIYHKNLMVFLQNGKKLLFLLNTPIVKPKNTNLSQFYFDLSDVSVYRSCDNSFILPKCEDNYVIYQKIQVNKSNSNFIQILPPFYGSQTEQIISNLLNEILISSNHLISQLMNHISSSKNKSGSQCSNNRIVSNNSSHQITANNSNNQTASNSSSHQTPAGSNDDQSLHSNLVSNPIQHIEYALDLAEIILKNELDRDQNLCEFGLIALTRFLILNIYQLNAKNEKLERFQMKRITHLFMSMKMSAAHFETLVSLITIINHGIYTRSFIKNVLHPFIFLYDDRRYTTSFILFINNPPCYKIKQKMQFMQDKINDFVGIYNEKHLDQELIPFINAYFSTLLEAINDKSIPNILVSTFLSKLIPFLCIMDNTPRLSKTVLIFFLKHIEQLFARINPVLSKFINSFQSKDPFANECIFDEYSDLTKDDLMIYLLPTAIVNCIRICFDSIEITKVERENKSYFLYAIKSKETQPISLNQVVKTQKRSISDFISSIEDEKTFLNGLNRDSLLIKRLSECNKPRFKISDEIKDIEILIFKTLLQQIQYVKYAMVTQNDQKINPKLQRIWSKAIKVESKLLFRAQKGKMDKNRFPNNLKNLQDDFVQSIKDKCQFLLQQKSPHPEIDIDSCYSFITSDISLSDLCTLQSIAKEREDIRSFSLDFIEQIVTKQMPGIFLNDIVENLVNTYQLRHILMNNQNLVTFLMNSENSFLHLCVFDFIDIDCYQKCAQKMLDNETNEKVHKFLSSLTYQQQLQYDLKVFLGYIGRCHYDLTNKVPKNYDICAQKVLNKVDPNQLLDYVTGKDDISLGALAMIFQIKTHAFDRDKLFATFLKIEPCMYEIASQLSSNNNPQNENPNQNFVRNNMFLNYFFGSLDYLIKDHYNYFVKMAHFPTLLSKYEKFYSATDSLSIKISDFIETYHEFLEFIDQDSAIPPCFIQIKGPVNESNTPNTIVTKPDESNFYVFSKTIEECETITFELHKQSDRSNILLIGSLNHQNDFIGFSPDYSSFSNSTVFTLGYIFDSTNLKINLMRAPNSTFLSLFVQDDSSKRYIPLLSGGISSYQIPFIYAYRVDYTITYEYFPNFQCRPDYSFEELSFVSIKTSRYAPKMPLGLVGRKIVSREFGDAIIIKTDDFDSTACVSLVNHDGTSTLATIDLNSRFLVQKTENNFLTLLRSLSIYRIPFDLSVFDNILIDHSRYMFEKHLLICLAFTNVSFIQRILSPAYQFGEMFLALYKTQVSQMIDSHLSDLIPILNCEQCRMLIENRVIADPISFLLLINEYQWDFLQNHCRYLEYLAPINYQELGIDNSIDRLFRVLQNPKLVYFLSIDAFVLACADLIDFLVINAFDKIKELKLTNSFIASILTVRCHYPVGLPLLLAFVYANNYDLISSYTVPENNMFQCTLKCQCINKDLILEPRIQYSFGEKIEFKVIRPEIDDVVNLIQVYNQQDRSKTFVELYKHSPSLPTIPIKDLNISGNILYLYIVLIEILYIHRNESLFVMKTIDEKYQYLTMDVCPNKHYLSLSFDRIHRSHDKNLLFQQFCLQVRSHYALLRSHVPFLVHFVGEKGADAGGLRREAITLIHKEMIDVNNNIFVKNEDGYFVPSRLRQPHVLEIAGAFVACCLYSKNPRDFHLDPMIWRHLITSDFTNDPALRAFSKGFHTIIPRYHLRYFTEADLRNLTCGESLTIERFLNSCKFYNDSIQAVFSEVVSSFRIDELKLLLRLITGSEYFPFDSNLTININFRTPTSDDEKKWPLPVFHTCFNSTDICDFKSPAILNQKLRIAMENFEMHLP